MINFYLKGMYRNIFLWTEDTELFSSFPLDIQVITIETPHPVKEEEENAMHNTVVIFSSNDNFTLKQDMCVVCGSFGLGAEGRLLACAQCGQCYHPYCVGIKVHLFLNLLWI